MIRNGLIVPRTEALDQKAERRRHIVFACILAAITFVTLCLIVNPAFASYTNTIRDIMEDMVDIVGTIFQAVGVILSIYAVGQLVLAFKNEDANAKSSASTLLVVGIVLIAIPGIIDALNLVDMIG